MNRVILAVAAAVALAAGAFAADPVKPVASENDKQLRAEIVALQDKLAQLDAQQRETKKVEAQKRAFAAIQEATRARAERYARRLKDVETAEEPGTDERNAYFNALLAHIHAMERMDDDILALKDYTALARARELQDAVEVRDAEWYMVKEADLDRRAQLADMTKAAQQNPSPALDAMVKDVQALFASQTAAAQKEFAQWTEGHAARRKVQERVDQFWDAVQEAKAKAAKEIKN